MKKIFIGAITGLLLCSTLMAADQKVAPLKPVVIQPELSTIEGSISSVDVNSGTLKLVTDNGKTINVLIKGAEVTGNNKKILASNLKPGERVKISYMLKGTQYLAKSVGIINMN